MRLRWWRSRSKKWNKSPGGLFGAGYDAQTDLGMSSGGQAVGSGDVAGGEGISVQRPPDPGYDIRRDVGF